MSNNIEGTVVVITGACTGLAKRSPGFFRYRARASRWVRGASIASSHWPDDLTGRGGGLRRRVALQSPAAADDGSGRRPATAVPARQAGRQHLLRRLQLDRPDADRRRHLLSRNARTAADRLAHYASQFPIVEVDATYYALPSERNAHLWVERTPPGFVFNIKAFGLFTHHPVVVERLPAAVKELLPAAIAEKSRVYLRDIPEEAEKLIWEMQAQALAPLAAAGKLGCVLFQFPHWFTARRAHIRYLEQLRDRSDWPLAVEFRGGGWMTDNYRAGRSLSSRSWASPTSSSTSRRGSVRRRRRSWHRPVRSPSSASTATTPRPTRSRTSAPPNGSATCTRRRS